MEYNQTTRNILVAVDIQNDFIDGSLAVAEGEHVVEPINEIATSVRASNGTAVFTRDWHPASTPHFETWPVHCVADTPGAAYHPELDVHDNNVDIVISKGMGQTDGYSGWEGISDSGQTLETIIEPHSPEEKVRVFIGGLATDYCVKATAIDIAAHFKDDARVSLHLLRDAIRAVGIKPTDEDEALCAMREAGIYAMTVAEAKELIERTAL